MSRHVLLTRPKENAQATKGLLEKNHYRVTLAPLLIHEPLDTPQPVGDFDCLIITSVYAAAALPQLNNGREDIPVYVTGAATRQAVDDDGWKNVIPVDGGALDIVAALRDGSSSIETVLYPCAEWTAHDLSDLLRPLGITCNSWPVYRMKEVEGFPSGVEAALVKDEFDFVLLYSARTAKVFARLVGERLSRKVTILTLSAEIAESLGNSLGNRVVYPEKKTEKALLSLLEQTKSLTP